MNLLEMVTIILRRQPTDYAYDHAEVAQEIIDVVNAYGNKEEKDEADVWCENCGWVGAEEVSKVGLHIPCNAYIGPLKGEKQ